MTSSADPTSVRRSFPPVLGSPGAARSWVAEVLRSWGCDDLVDRALLIVSELVANAVLHGSGTVTVALLRSPRGVRIEVCDDGDGPVTATGGPVDRPAGRGLLIVDDLADGWGVDQGDRGKVVWALMAGATT
jgi:anti-sigma regulatory factor (Ser/Thr protein kinase)